MASNAGSRRVLEKVGMTQNASWAASEDKRQIPGWKHGEVYYELSRAEWTHRTTKSR